MRGDKSGIWRFYRRVWKNIFYERRDKERERGFLGGGEEGRSYIFFKIFFWVGGEFEILWGNVFFGVWVEWEMGCDMEYSLMECFL